MAIQDFPENALGILDEPTWAEVPVLTPTNTTPVAPSAPIAAAGLGSVTLTSRLFNYLLREPYRFIRALVHRTHRSDTGLIGSYVAAGGTYPTGGGTLSVQLPLTEVYVGGVLVQFADPLASPHVFTASRDSYLIVDAAGVRLDTEVANGAAVPGVVGTQVIVSKTVTDGTEVTTSTLVLGNQIVLGDVAITGITMGGNLDMDGNSITSCLDVGTATIATTGDVSIGGNLDLTSGSISNVTTLSTSGNVSIGGALDMTSGAISNATTVACVGLTATQASAGTAAITATNSLGPAISGVSSSAALGPGVDGQSASSYAGVTGSNSSTGPGVKGTGGSAAAGVDGLATVASQPGVKGTGAAAAGSNGVTGVAINTASYGVAGTASAAATTSGAGVRADGLGNAPALWAVAVDGHAALLTSDTSSPTRAALRITPQDSDPSSTGVGDILINSSLLNKIRHHNGSDYLSVHSSSKGFIWVVGASASSTLTSGNSIDLSTTVIIPEVVGTVLVCARGYLSWAVDGASTSILVRDDTAGVTINGGGSGWVEYPNVGAVARGHSFIAEVPYTLPSAATRTFKVRLTAAVGTTTYTDVTVSVTGVQ
jgi:hypothetical protein